MTDTATGTEPDIAPDADRTLTVTRHLSAPRETVFRAWTDPSELVRWWGPEGVTIPVCEVDLRPGGAWRTCMLGSQGQENICSGVYREIAEPERLEFTWAWETDGVRGHETIITVEFHERDGGTDFVLTQRVFETAKSRDDHGMGWSSSMMCLERHLATRYRD